VDIYNYPAEVSALVMMKKQDYANTPQENYDANSCGGENDKIHIEKHSFKAR
jgi:hypothetical protein